MATNPKYVAMFLKEAGEHLESLAKGVIALESAPHDRSLSHELMRNAHTIKGAARMLGYEQIGQVAHRLEDLFKGVEEGTEPVTPALVDLLLAGCDALQGLIGNLAAGRESLPDVTLLLDCVERRELPSRAMLDGLRAQPAVTVRAGGDVRLPVAALDSLQGCLGELVIGKQRFEARLRELRQLARACSGTVPGLWELQGRLEDDILELDGLLEEINAQVMGLRLLPLRTVTEGFARVLRDLARTQGKLAQLRVEGDDLELDRHLLEQLRPSFIHLLTNAVAHGLESPAERELAGKPATGTVCISARVEGETAVIVFRDDGRGMDPAAIRTQAMTRRLLTPERAALLSDDQVLGYTLMPGFSTASAVTDVAGRGVGLDVVQESLHKVKGFLEIRNEPGIGCSLILTLPRTLLTTRVLLVGSGGERYLIPASAIEETRSVHREDFDPAAPEPRLRELPDAPVADLGVLLGRPSVAAGGKMPAMVLKLREKRLVCLVERLYDTIDVVAKRLTPQLRKVFLVSGATVLPDGVPALILHVPDLFAAAEQSCSLAPFSDQPVIALPSILVVDDSMTSRTLEAAILAAQGYRVDTAENGREALELLDQKAYGLVISDVEMPVMDGLELVRRVRERFDEHELPVMTVSSLTSGNQYREALAAGAQLYLTKGEFDQDVFLRCVRQLLDQSG